MKQNVTKLSLNYLISYNTNLFVTKGEIYIYILACCSDISVSQIHVNIQRRSNLLGYLLNGGAVTVLHTYYNDRYFYYVVLLYKIVLFGRKYKELAVLLDWLCIENSALILTTWGRLSIFKIYIGYHQYYPSTSGEIIYTIY